MNDAEIAVRVHAVLLQVVDEINRQLPAARRLPPSADTVLTGSGGMLDSLGLINFIVLAEERLSKEFGKRVALTDESLGPDVEKNFATVRSISEHARRLISPS